MMKQKRYDIFISYRRHDVGDKAEHLKDLLEPCYKRRISFDRENLMGIFDVALIRRIDSCRDFILVLGKRSLVYTDDAFTEEQVELYRYMATCSQEAFDRKIEEMGHNAQLDFVRIEIARALQRKDLHIIPVVPESTDTFGFNRLRLPPDIAAIQRREAVFYSDNPDALFKDVVPKIRTHLQSRSDMPARPWLIGAAMVALVVAVVGGIFAWRSHRAERERRELMAATEFCGEPVNWLPNVAMRQVRAVNSILGNMVSVAGGSFTMGALPDSVGGYDDDVDPDIDVWPADRRERSVGQFWIGKHELTVGEWHGIWGGDYDGESADLPMTGVNFDQCQALCDTLYQLTNLPFALPTEEQWEYAARGGAEADATKYAGRDNPDEVAWYGANALGQPHRRLSGSSNGFYANGLDLFDMSGNVSEWTSTPFAPTSPELAVVDPEAMAVRGGNYDSPAYGITVYHRDLMNRHESAATVGVRLIINSIEQ